ncbi:hypothetical protein IFM89_021743 [Coptis chinensis]|uniref:Uncharacterized protein n=1 Tax=Coptis chinensis TaxID=261450 RepID=A0A835H5L8_9MAGN|nr:hypothetical protein IFM89_021743 [Coptis chinensis]
MDDSILIDEVGEQEEYGSVLEPYTGCSSSVQPPEFEVEVEIVNPPCLGMCFETLEAAKQFYIDYGKSFGFSPDGPNLDSEYLESIHSAVHGFAFRSWPKIQNLGLKPYVNSSVCPLGLFDGLTLLGLLGLDCQSALLLPLFVAFQVILTIAVFRVFVGVGEASFVSLAAPFIDDNAPVAQKTAWLVAFYMCIPGGIACGYVLGGLTGYTKTQHCLGQLLWPFGLPAMLYQSSSDFVVLLSGCSDDEVGLLWCPAKPFVESKTL